MKIASELSNKLTLNNAPQMLLEIKEAKDKHPENLRLNMLYGRALRMSGQVDEAITHTKKLVCNENTGWKSAAFLAKLYLAKKDFNRFNEALSIAIDREAPSAAIEKLEVQKETICNNRESSLEQHEKLMELSSSDIDAETHIKHALYLHKANRHKDGVDALLLALGIDGETTIPSTFTRMAIMALGEEKSISIISDLCNTHPNNCSLIQNHAKILRECGRGDEIFELYRKNKNCFKGDYLHVVMRNDVPEDLVRDQESYYRSINERSPENHIKSATRWFTKHGYIDEAQKLSDLLSEKTTKYNSWLNSAHRLTKPLRKINDVDTKTDEIISSITDDADGTVLVFAGIHGETWAPLSFFEEVFASLNLSAIYLKDKQRLLFLNGLNSVSDDYSSTIDHLKLILSRTNTKRIFTLSTSAGGTAAICYGLDLGAEAALCFSAATNLMPEFLKDEPRGIVIQKRIFALSDKNKDSRILLESASNNMAVHLYYGKDCTQDRRHSEYLSGVKNVTLHPLNSDLHDSLSHATNVFGLHNVLKECYDL